MFPHLHGLGNRFPYPPSRGSMIAAGGFLLFIRKGIFEAGGSPQGGPASHHLFFRPAAPSQAVDDPPPFQSGNKVARA